MQTVQASVILDDIQQQIGWDTTQLEPRQSAMSRMAVSLALQEIWESNWWTTLMVCAQMSLAPVYASGTNYTAGTVVLDPATQQYFQCVRSLASAITVSGADQSWANGIYSQSPYLDGNGNPVYLDAAGDPISQANGAWIIWQLTNNPFPGAVVQTYLWNATDTPPVSNNWENYNTYVQIPGMTTTTAQAPTISGVVNAGFWALAQPSYTCGDWTANTIYMVGDQVRNPTDGNYYQCYTAHTSTTVLDPTKFGLLLPFYPLVPVNGPVRSVSAFDPRQTVAPNYYPTQQEADGWHVSFQSVINTPIGQPYVYSRRVTPVITGDAYDPTVAYSATAAQDLVFDS